MKISASLTGDLRGMADDLIAGLKTGSRAAVQAAAVSLQSDLRNQTSAALGRRTPGANLSKAWGLAEYSNKDGGPASVVYSKSREVLSAFANGATINASGGKFLVIPTEEAERRGFATSNSTRAGKGVGSIPRRVSMIDKAARALGKRNLKLLPSKQGGYVLAYMPGRGQKPVVLFVYVRQVQLAKRLDFDGAVSRAETRLGAELGKAFAG